MLDCTHILEIVPSPTSEHTGIADHHHPIMIASSLQILLKDPLGCIEEAVHVIKIFVQTPFIALCNTYIWF